MILSPYFLYSGEGFNNLFEDKDEAGLRESIEHMQGLTFACQIAVDSLSLRLLSGKQKFLKAIKLLRLLWPL